MAVTKEKKAVVLDRLKNDFDGMKSAVFAQFSGLSVKDMTELRKKLREENSSLYVAKKTLIRLAAKDAGFTEIPDAAMEGPIAVAISKNDEVTPAKVIHGIAKGNESVKICGGIVDGELLTAAQMKEIATIPSKEELYAKLVGSMQSPIYGFYGTMRNVLSGFVRVCDAIAQKQA